MDNSKIKYYPVGNGDHSIISVVEGGCTTNIMVDCNIRESSKGDDDETKFDVKADVIETLNKKTVNGIKDVSYTDLFSLTHGDIDHLRGFEKNFYQGDPAKYSQKNKDAEEILIDTLWFSPMVMGESTNADEDCFNEEARRRIKLHREKDPRKDDPGNRIAIIGYDANEDLDGLDLVRYVPGDIVTRFNDRDFTSFSIFIHAPYKEQLKSAESDKNHTSVVFQARFIDTTKPNSFLALAMFGGDADHYAWKKILEKTKKHNNHENHKALDWDYFMAPHHCSWSYFNDTPQSEHPTPQDYSLEILDFKRKDAKVIASCKEIKNNDDNPPHYQAKQQYVKKVGNDNFWHTETYKVENNTPQPIIIEITNTSTNSQATGAGIATSRIIKPHSNYSY